ncbi:MAG: NUDIX domain-containing protein [Elusimicrobia bacterium]|nr:NUDIX domain-containing protein [Elusimicrobiota bacterium]
MTSRERAAGGVVARGGKVLLVRVENLEGRVLWTFPKGHLEAGERWRDAALREVEEETGWLCRTRGRLAEIRYRFRRKGRPVAKRVVWFRMEPLERTGKPDADEILAARWFPAAAAARALGYPNDRRLLARWRTGGETPVTRRVTAPAWKKGRK